MSAVGGDESSWLYLSYLRKILFVRKKSLLRTSNMLHQSEGGIGNMCHEKEMRQEANGGIVIATDVERSLCAHSL